MRQRTRPLDDLSPHLHTLANGVRLLVVHLPQARTACVSLFLRSGSAHEPQRLAGISHLVEHMVFKGSATRNYRQINLDAERLGAEVNAHTDRDHTAYHMRGLGEHSAQFVRMLADIVLGAQFPADELVRERAVVLQEFAEYDDDPVATAFRLLDAASFGRHPAARPIIGRRASIQAIGRDDLVAYTRRQYTGCNTVLAVAGPLPPEALLAEVQAQFGAMPSGEPNQVAAAPWQGGLRSKAMAGCSQTQVVLGFAIPPQPADDATSAVAATLLGEGMSSPLLDELREQRGLVYHAACSADVLDMCGQFIIEASLAPEHVDEYLREVTRLLARQAEQINPVDLERARNQLRVRQLRQLEQPHQLLEQLALDWLSVGRVRGPQQLAERLAAVDAQAVRAAFERLIASGAALALTGRVARGLRDRVPGLMAVPLGGTGGAAGAGGAAGISGASSAVAAGPTGAQLAAPAKA